ncbi:G-protein coupled receptor family C group 6 member A-like protein, partial [Lates japonicus]
VDVISRCSNSCDPGYRKKSAQPHPLCCYECEPCPENYYSNTSDSTECHRCDPDTQYSYNRTEMCTPKTVVFLKWTDPYNCALLAFTALGALLTIVVGIIFLARWNTPVVRASVGPICILLLFSLLSTFVSVILFGGKPNAKQCKARQVLFGLSFTLCVACIMVKSFKIILAFEFDPSVKRVLKKLYQPYIIIAVCMAGQVLICALWLSLKSPEPGYDNMKNKMERLHFCNEMFSTARLVQSLIMVHAVEEVNKNHELGNLTLGYSILDSCSDVTTALNNTLSFMRRNACAQNSSLDGAEQPSPPVLAVIGDYYSEISIAVTRQLNLEHIPQISYGATSGLLSDKVRFPSFMRTVPEDDHQAQAIIKILRKHQWNW